LDLAETLRDDGIRGLLMRVNEHGKHRFTAINCAFGDQLRHLYFHDRENPGLKPVSDTPLDNSYCCIVIRSGTELSIENAATDQRVAAHVLRDQVLSYVGVPLVDHDGVTFGTICSFDNVSLPVTETEIRVLEEAAAVVSPPLEGLVEASAPGETEAADTK
jgi:GAF domain-containing protein